MHHQGHASKKKFGRFATNSFEHVVISDVSLDYPNRAYTGGDSPLTPLNSGSNEPMFNRSLFISLASEPSIVSMGSDGVGKSRKGNCRTLQLRIFG